MSDVEWLNKAILVVLLFVGVAAFVYFSALLSSVSMMPETSNNESNATTTPSIDEVLTLFPEITSSSTETIPEESTIAKNVTVAPEPKIPVLTPSSTLPQSLPIEIGVFAGTIPELYTFEHRMGEQVNIAATAVHWGNENNFPEAYANLVTGRSTTLLIYWYPMDYREDAEGQDAFHFAKILNGSWDAYLDSFAQSAARNGGDIVIAPFEEVNGSWTHWNGVSETYGTKEEYIETFRYLRDKFKNAPNVRFAWVINQVSVPDTSENAISTYYPGDAYVDLIGINAFNFGTPWLSFDTLIGRAVSEVLPYHKPIYITSTASAPGEEKATWIQNMFQSTYFKNGIVKGFVWFNEYKERDWRVWSDQYSEEVFRNSF